MLQENRLGNIESLQELNDVINKVVNYIVETSTEHTSSSNWYVGYEDVDNLISQEDFEKYFNLIGSELRGREEVSDLEIEGNEFSVTYYLDYCPNYQWCQGDEEVFHMSEEEWEKNYQCKAVSQPLSLTRLAEIGDKAIPFILSQFNNGLEELQKSLGMTEEELVQMKVLNDVPNLHEKEKAKPVDKGVIFEVNDPRSIVRKLHKTLGEAIKAYEDIGNIKEKTLSIILPAESKITQPVCLLQREEGSDFVTNLSDLPPIPEVYEAYTDLEGYRSGKGLDARIKKAEAQSKQQIQTEGKEKSVNIERE